uniref:Uncharacterized protein n=1 Tax=Spongospora subterranea TaxID=70186 RepID=A0A0H5QIS7_9EUKA|eukprot:CRZ01552.1 hypothetical protein [Spongospora subterranea]
MDHGIARASIAASTATAIAMNPPQSRPSVAWEIYRGTADPALRIVRDKYVLYFPVLTAMINVVEEMRFREHVDGAHREHDQVVAVVDDRTPMEPVDLVGELKAAEQDRRRRERRQIIDEDLVHP